MAEVCLIRRDRNGSEGPLVDVLTVPDSLLDQPERKLAVYDYIRKICLDYEAANQTEEPMQPVDFLNLPAEFLAGYGVAVRPIDVPLAITLDMDHEITYGYGQEDDPHQEADVIEAPSADNGQEGDKEGADAPDP